MAKLTKERQSLILLTFITILWAFAYIPTSFLLQQNISNEVILFLRFSIGAIILLIFAFKEIKKMSLLDLKIGFFAGLAIFFAVYFQNQSLLFTSVSKTAFIAGMSMLLVPYLAYLINKKDITNVHINGTIIAFIGMVVFSLNPADFKSTNIGDFLALLSALGFALQIVALEKHSTINTVSVSFIQIVTVAIGAFILVLVNDADIKLAFTNNNIPAIIYLSVIATGFAYVIQANVAKYLSSIIVIVFLSSQAIIAFIFDVIFFNTPITLRFLIGATLITIALLYLTFRKPKSIVFKNKKKTHP